MKKYISMLLAVCLALGMICVPAHAAESGTCGENLTWTLSDDGVLTVSGTGDMDGYSSKGSPWYEHRESVTSLVIESGVTSVGELAFYAMHDLKTVVIGESVTEIGSAAFEDCRGLESVSLPQSLRVIGDNAFAACIALKQVELPKKLEMIDEAAFFNCRSLPQITIPGSVTAIERNAFAYCYLLNSVTFAGAAPVIEESAFDNVTAGVLYYPDSGTWTQDNMLDYSGTLTWIPIAQTGAEASGTCGDGLNWNLSNGVLTITGSGAMDVYSPEVLPPWYNIRGYIRQVNLPEGLTNISDYAFCNAAALETVSMPASVTSIGSYAFYGCAKLKSLTFSGNAPAISEQAFSGIALTIRYDGQKQGWEDAAAGSYEGGLTWQNYSLSCDVHIFGEYTQTVAPTCSVSGLQIRSCTLCDAQESREVAPLGHAFATETVAPDCDSAGYTVSECSVCGEYYMHDYVAAVGHSWDEGEKLSSVTTLHTCTVCDATWEVSVAKGTCGSGVTWSFDGYTGKLTISGTGKMKDYTSAALTPWASYSDGIISVAVESGVTAVGNNAFAELNSLAQAELADTVTAVGSKAFYSCDSLRTVQLPANLTQLADSTFAYCRKLNTVDIPASVTAIGEDVFYYCEALAQVDIPAGITAIGESAFYGCSKIRSVVIPEGVTQISDYCFSACRALTDVQLHDGITEIGANAFATCPSLQQVQLPEKLTTIGSAAFFNCTSLASMTIPATVTEMGNTVFFGCYGLGQVEFTGDAPADMDQWTNTFMNVTTTVYYPAGNETWTEDIMLDYGGTVTWKAACGQHTWTQWEIIGSAAQDQSDWRERSCIECGYLETEPVPQPEYFAGDVDHDGAITAIDAMLVRQYVAQWELAVFYRENADMDGDGIISAVDAMLIRTLIAN